MNFGRRLAAAVVAAVSGVAFAVTDVPVTEGEVEFDTSKNSTSYTYVISGGAVVKLPETAGDFEVKCYVTCTNGVATIDATAVAGDMRFSSYVRGAATGTLNIKGKGRVNVGATPTKNDYFYANTRWNVPNITFADAEGAAIDSPEGVRLVGSACPTALSETVPTTIVQGSAVFVYDADMAAALFGDSTDIVVEDGFQLIFLSAGAMPKDATVTVRPGGKLRFKGLYFRDDATASMTALNNQTYPAFSIVLDGDGATPEKRPQLWFNSNKFDYYNCTLTGKGDISVQVGGGNDSLVCNQWIAGPVSFTGGVYIVGEKDRITLGAADGMTLTNATTASQGLIAIHSGTHGPVNVNVANVSKVGSDIASGELVNLNLPAGIDTAEIDDGAIVHHVRTKTPGVIDNYAALRFETDTPVLLAKAGVSAANLPANVSVRVSAEQAVEIPGGGAKRVIAVDEGGKATLTPVDGWKASAAIWLDPSRTDLITGLGSRVNTMGDTYVNAYQTTYGTLAPLNTRVSGDLLVEYLADCRPERTDNAGYLNRLYFKDGISKQVQVYLISRPNGPNGNAYLDSGIYNTSVSGKVYQDEIGAGTAKYSSGTAAARRLPFTSSVNAQMVMVVYGSQNGGGWEIIGTDGGKLLRDAAWIADPTQPIIKSGAYETWVDGQKVDPTKTGFNGGWQIITMKLAGLKIYGPGLTKNTYNNCGNQYWGDILVFTNDVTDAQRINAERTLAAKWGIDYRGSSDDAVQLTGNGTVETANDLTLRGNFTGTLRLADGARLTIPDEKLPYGVEDIPAEGRVGWFDPEAEDSLAYKDIAYPQEIMRIYDRASGKDGNTSMYGSGARAPHVERGARGTGPAVNWVDYNDLLANRQVKGGQMLYQGNVMRLVENPTSTTQQAWDVQTGFIVQDSARGGGTPFACDIDASGSKKVRARKVRDPGSAIYQSGTMDALTKGGIWLDGAARANADGFTGRQEVFAFEVKDSTIPLLCFAQYPNTEGDKTAWPDDPLTPKGNWIGEIQGEILLYDRALSEEVRGGINAYLMGKWLGRLPAGYADPRGVTVAGQGTVDVPRLALMPQFADDFNGTATVSGDEAAFVYDNRVIAGAVNAGGADVVLGDVAVTVDFRNRPKAGAYPLVSAKSITAGALTLNATGVLAGHEVKLRLTADTLYLDVLANGMTIIVR